MDKYKQSKVSKNQNRQKKENNQKMKNWPKSKVAKNRK